MAAPSSSAEPVLLVILFSAVTRTQVRLLLTLNTGGCNWTLDNLELQIKQVHVDSKGFRAYKKAARLEPAGLGAMRSTGFGKLQRDTSS